jgi:protocatechuate 3,4-dioxygenase beta subunit
VSSAIEDHDVEVPALPVTSRRDTLQLLGVAGIGALIGCQTDGTGAAAGSAGMMSGRAGAGASADIGAKISSTTAGSPSAPLPSDAKIGAGGSAGTRAGTGGRGGNAAVGGSAAGSSAGAPSSAEGMSGTGGAAGTASSSPRTAGGGAAADGSDAGSPSTAVECPSEDTPAVPEGPYYYDSMMNRSDITDGKDGVPITYRFTLLDAECRPIQGAVVDIWQADKDGVYSAYAQQGTAGEVFLRGFQYTGAQGEAAFNAIYPGWYSGRLTHLHGKVFIEDVQQDTTNFFFPADVEDAVYASPLYAARGRNRATVAGDIELRGDMQRFDALTMTVTGDVASGYVASFVLRYS